MPLPTTSWEEFGSETQPLVYDNSLVYDADLVYDTGGNPPSLPTTTWEDVE